MTSRLIVLLVLAALAAGAESLNPSSYSMPNGQLGPAGLLYRDDIYRGTAGDPHQDLSLLAGGLGQLADGTTFCADDPRTDCGSGDGYEWVGWRDDVTIVFSFGERCDFDNIRIYTANWPDAGVRIWKMATVSVSEDGLSYHDFAIHNTTDQERQNTKARYIDIPLKGTGQVVRIRLNRDPGSWMLISEIRFDGNISKSQTPRVR